MTLSLLFNAFVSYAKRCHRTRVLAINETLCIDFIPNPNQKFWSLSCGIKSQTAHEHP